MLETVLIVDDDSNVRDMARLVLARKGYNVLTAPTVKPPSNSWLPMMQQKTSARCYAIWNAKGRRQGTHPPLPPAISRHSDHRP